MESIYVDPEHFAKLCESVPLPKKPKFGSIGKWISLVFGIVLSGWGFFNPQKTSVFQWWDYSEIGIGLMIVAICIFMMVNNYVREYRGYQFSQRNRYEYQKTMVYHFLKEQEISIEYDELLIEEMKNMSSKKKRRLARKKQTISPNCATGLWH